MRRLAKLAVLIAASWVVFCAVMYFQMTRPPERFASFMARLPGAVFLITPFEPLWNRARAGTLQVGDAAPDFRLKTLDGKAEVSLAENRGVRPVVLIFGSYT